MTAPGDLIVVRRTVRRGGPTHAGRVLAVSAGGELVRVAVWSERSRAFRRARWMSRLWFDGDLPTGDRRRKDIERADLVERARRAGEQ